MTVRTIETEVQLLDWSETAKGGCKIVLQLPGPEDLEHFRAMTLAKGGKAGQVLMAVFAPVDPSEAPPEPVEAAHRKPGPLCILAAQWCRDPHFARWLRNTFFKWNGKGMASVEVFTEAECRAVILDRCKIGSRRELDTVPAARETFERDFRKPYMDYLDGAHG